MTQLRLAMDTGAYQTGTAPRGIYKGKPGNNSWYKQVKFFGEDRNAMDNDDGRLTTPDGKLTYSGKLVDYTLNPDGKLDNDELKAFTYLNKTLKSDRHIPDPSARDAIRLLYHDNPQAVNRITDYYQAIKTRDFNKLTKVLDEPKIHCN